MIAALLRCRAPQAGHPESIPMLFAHFTTSEGNFIVRLFDVEVPNTVAHFTGLAEGTREWTDPRTGRKVKERYYNGTIFHRVIAEFMIQGGDPLGQGTGGPGYQFADEIGADNHNNIGTIAMANSGPNTNGSQFFINVANNNFLDTKHTVFGKVVSGMDVVPKIENTQTGAGDKPVSPMIINSVEVK